MGNGRVALQILTLTPGGGEQHIHVPVALLPEKQPPVTNAPEAGLQDQCGCNGERDKSLSSAGNRTLTLWLSSPQTSCYTD
jgi:hypothetical protein